MKSGFKERLAFFYLLSTAVLIFLLFIVICVIVKRSAFHYLQSNIIKETHKHLKDIKIKRGKVFFNANVWLQSEHNIVEVNPVFIEITGKDGVILDKSPNLKSNELTFSPHTRNGFVSKKLSGIPILQYQYPIIKNGKKLGYLIVAMSQKGPLMVIGQLKKTLFIAYPVLLVILFFLARYIAGKGIKPVRQIIYIADKITGQNLNERIPLPQKKDELYLLAKTINQLLIRIESAIEREKQFTSDAAHELKTPLQVMKGNMEVLIRKERTITEYKTKIQKCLLEINKMDQLTDQLLLLARFESQKFPLRQEMIDLGNFIESILLNKRNQIEQKKLRLKQNLQMEIWITTDPYLLEIIIDNILTNAIKYTEENGEITLELKNFKNRIYLHITDTGIGISKEAQKQIYDRFYREASLSHSSIKGFGLGLSIVKRLAQILFLDIELKSNNGKGTTVTLKFPTN